MISMLRLIFLFALSAFSLQVWSSASSYSYDAVQDFIFDQNVEFDAQIYDYDRKENLHNCCGVFPISDSKEKTLNGSFFALVDGFVVTKGGDDLFRVVDDVELADIQKTGGFRTAPGSFEGKQFVDNLDDAKALQKKFSDFFGGNQTIVRGQAPKSVLDNASRTPFSDIPNGTAITVPIKDLPKVKPNL